MYQNIQSKNAETRTKQKAFLKKFHGEDLGFNGETTKIDDLLDRMNQLARAFHFDPTYIFRTLDEEK